MNGEIPGKSENGDMGDLVGYLQETGELRSWIKAVSMRMKKGTRCERELKTDKPCIQWYGAEGHIYKDKKLFLPSLESQHLSTSSFAYTRNNTIESLEKAKTKHPKFHYSYKTANNLYSLLGLFRNKYFFFIGALLSHVESLWYIIVSYLSHEEAVCADLHNYIHFNVHIVFHYFMHLNFFSHYSIC